MNKKNLMIVAHLFDKINNMKLDDTSRVMLKDSVKQAKDKGFIKTNVKDCVYIKDSNYGKPLIFIDIEDDTIKVNSQHIWNIICNYRR